MTSQEVAEVLKEFDIKLVVPPVITIPKQSITFQIKPVINEEQYDIHSLGYDENDDESDVVERMYIGSSIGYFDHSVLQKAADENRLRMI